jgi:hypothetical protein
MRNRSAKASQEKVYYKKGFVKYLDTHKLPMRLVIHRERGIEEQDDNL